MRFAVILDGPRAGEGDLGVGQQVRQRRAQFMGDVGGKRRESLKESSRRPSMALKWWAISASSGGMFSSGSRALSDCAETPLAIAPMRRNGRNSAARAAQVTQEFLVARADKPTVSQIRRCMRCRKCWWWVMFSSRVNCGESGFSTNKGAFKTR